MIEATLDQILRMLGDVSTRLERLERSRERERGPLLSVAEAAAIASVVPKTIRNWLDAGELKTYRAGRELRVDRAELIAFMERGPLKNAEPTPEQLAIARVRGGR